MDDYQRSGRMADYQQSGNDSSRISSQWSVDNTDLNCTPQSMYSVISPRMSMNSSQIPSSSELSWATMSPFSTPPVAHPYYSMEAPKQPAFREKVLSSDRDIHQIQSSVSSMSINNNESYQNSSAMNGEIRHDNSSQNGPASHFPIRSSIGRVKNSKNILQSFASSPKVSYPGFSPRPLAPEDGAPPPPMEMPNPYHHQQQQNLLHQQHHMPAYLAPGMQSPRQYYASPHLPTTSPRQFQQQISHYGPPPAPVGMSPRHQYRQSPLQQSPYQQASRFMASPGGPSMYTMSPHSGNSLYPTPPAVLAATRSPYVTNNTLNTGGINNNSGGWNNSGNTNMIDESSSRSINLPTTSGSSGGGLVRQVRGFSEDLSLKTTASPPGPPQGNMSPTVAYRSSPVIEALHNSPTKSISSLMSPSNSSSVGPPIAPFSPTGSSSNGPKSKTSSAKGSPVVGGNNNKASPAGPQTVYLVQFKRTCREFVPSPRAPHNITIGEVVIVQCQRGEDIGVVIEEIPLQTFVEKRFLAKLNADPSEQEESSNVTHILRFATAYDKQQLPEKHKDEQEVIKTAKEMAADQFDLPMEIIDAEYQFDRQKLTIYYTSESRIDFRDFVKEMFSTFNVRVWMKKINPNNVFQPKPYAQLLLTTGKQTFDANNL